MPRVAGVKSEPQQRPLTVDEHLCELAGDHRDWANAVGSGVEQGTG